MYRPWLDSSSRPHSSSILSVFLSLDVIPSLAWTCNLIDLSLSSSLSLVSKVSAYEASSFHDASNINENAKIFIQWAFKDSRVKEIISNIFNELPTKHEKTIPNIGKRSPIHCYL